MARQIGIDTDELLAVLKNWKKQGKLRRIGAIVNHFKIGLTAGAMIAWQIEPERVVEVGQKMAGFEQISHVYQRRTKETWPYNLYTMLHAANAEDLQKIIDSIHKLKGICSYRVLQTEKELKKIPPTYIA